MARELWIGQRRIADDAPAWVCAEIGNNHGGSVEVCEQMIRAAADCGADAVKLQKRNNATLFTAEEFDAPYNSENAFGPTYGTHRLALEFDFEQYAHLKAFATSFGVMFFATAFDISSLEFLEHLGVPAIKLASASAVNVPLIRAAAATGLPVIASTAGATLGDIDLLYDLVPASRLALLQCTAVYPCPAELLNLRMIEVYRERYSCVVGLSDHYDGTRFIETAYGLGARIFEKHFTLDHAAKGSDNPWSLEPEGLRQVAKTLALIPLALGDGEKRLYDEERSSLRKMGRREL